MPSPLPVALCLGLCLIQLAVLGGLLWLHQRRARATDEARQLALLQRLGEDLERFGGAAAREARQGRGELSEHLRAIGQLLGQSLEQGAGAQRGQLESFGQQLARLTQNTDSRLESLRQAVEQRLSSLQADNAAKLEQIRHTVDEKLHTTLETRLGESFKQVGERLDQVNRGLGEMQVLAQGVGDLKKVLTNVKTRGTWGEVQLGNLLEQVLTPDQFAREVNVHPQASERVEYAIRLPGLSNGEGPPVWLPIDAKFPQEDYQRLIEASEAGLADQVQASAAALRARVVGEAKKIRDKYICPPHTTDFAILFLPTEGLFAEVLRIPGLCEGIMRDHRVVLAGPTTLCATLNSLQMGFRTLAIGRRSSEVWQVLGEVKAQFTKFGTVLDKVQKKLSAASNEVQEASKRSRVLTQKLGKVETHPAGAADSPLEGLADAGRLP